MIRGFAKLLRIRRFELVLANEPQSTCMLEAGSFGFKLMTFSGIRKFFWQLIANKLSPESLA